MHTAMTFMVRCRRMYCSLTELLVTRIPMKPTAHISRVFNLGTGEGTAAPLRKRIVLSNQIAAILVVIMLVGAPTNLQSEDRAMLLGLTLLAGVAVSVPVLNGIGLTTISRLVLVLAPPVLLIGPFVIAGPVGLSHLMVLPYALLTMSLLPLILFHEKSERLQQRIGIVVIGLVLLGHDRLLVPALASEDQAWAEAELGEIKLGAVILWGLIIASVRFLGQENSD